jgi:hypothetical protein
MQIQDELPALFAHDIQTAFEHRNDDVWALRTRDAAPVYGVSAARLTGLDGFSRDDAKLIPSMAVAIALSHMFSAGHNEPGLRERIAYVSGSGIIVAYPAISEQDVNPTLRSLASAGYFRNNLLGQSDAKAAMEHRAVYGRHWRIVTIPERSCLCRQRVQGRSDPGDSAAQS